MLALEIFVAKFVFWKRTLALSGVTGNDIVMENSLSPLVLDYWY